MSENTQIAVHNPHSQEQMKVAYALNMCTVSVSQIIDYRDAYILEQEYEAILNNLNLQEIPKDDHDALLKILSELLNTITFFRIQDIKKAQIERKYQQRVKNAIWSAIPNISVIASGSPVAIAFSLATQIGSGYMNYRKEKASAKSDQEDAEVELQITAIEQLNSLRRELFTTAWRLSDQYKFDDKLRLTEKQIKQYNEILLDQNEYRKYARLEAVASKFEAYPPFWYFYGHTASSIANTAIAAGEYSVGKQYKENAKAHFSMYYNIIKNADLLREDQLTASFALEYVDILSENPENNAELIHELMLLAESKAPTSFDILQLCAISYIKLGRTTDAARLLKILVNEEYNTVTNAKLLSRIYVAQYLADGDAASFADYKILSTQVDTLYLYPMPSASVDALQLEDKYLQTQKAILNKSYRHSLGAFERKQTVKFNSVLPAPSSMKHIPEDFYDTSLSATTKRKETVERVFGSKDRADYVLELKHCMFKAGYTDVLNDTVAGLQVLSFFRKLESYDALINYITSKIHSARVVLNQLQTRMDTGDFDYQDYKKLTSEYSFQYFLEVFFDKLDEKVTDAISDIASIETVEQYERELVEFCEMHQLPSPEQYLHMHKANDHQGIQTPVMFFSDDLLDIEREHQFYEQLRDVMVKAIKDDIGGIVLNPTKAGVYLFNTTEFNSYMENEKLVSPNSSKRIALQGAFAIIDDKQKTDFDLILCTDGIVVAEKNTIRYTIRYSKIKYSSSQGNAELKLGYPDMYTNKNVNIIALNGIVNKLDRVLRNLDVH